MGALFEGEDKLRPYDKETDKTGTARSNVCPTGYRLAPG